MKLAEAISKGRSVVQTDDTERVRLLGGALLCPLYIYVSGVCGINAQLAEVGGTRTRWT